MIGFDSLLMKDYIEIPLIKDTSIYDVIECEKEIKDIIKTFITIQLEYSNLIPPQITRNYDVVYHDIKCQTVKDNVGNFVIKKITCEKEAKEFYNDIYNALSKLNKKEVIYFTDALYNGESDASIAEKRNVSNYIVRQVKNSCIVKLAKYYNKVVYKKKSNQSNGILLREVGDI